MREIYFWQRIVSPHVIGLAEALSGLGCRVTFVASQEMSEKRASMGWMAPNSNSVRIDIASNRKEVVRAAGHAHEAAIHVTEGLRDNGLVGVAQKVLQRRGLRIWVAMETVSPIGWKGHLRRFEYRRLLRLRSTVYEGLLGIGHRTSDWLRDRGAPIERVFPFAYFVPTPPAFVHKDSDDLRRFRFIFVGQFIRRKRLDMLIEALRAIDSDQLELWVVGSGPLEKSLREQAENALPGRVRWIGRLGAHQVQEVIAAADCLVLPSEHDGWGAVVSEAMMVGTPVVCSDACGAAGVVVQSGHGSVFPSGDLAALETSLKSRMFVGNVLPNAREWLSTWAECLGADAGARYLMAIFDYAEGKGPKPESPWLTVGR